MCIYGLEKLGVVTSTSAAPAVGAGYERPLYYFANSIARMVATDLYDNPDHEGKPAMLTGPGKSAPFPYRKESLQALVYSVKRRLRVSNSLTTREMQ